MGDEVARLHVQLSSLQSLLTLSRVMGDSGDPRRIAALAGTAVASLSGCRLVGVWLSRDGWGLVGPAGGDAAAMSRLAGVLDGLGPRGGEVTWPAGAPDWAWAFPMQSAAGHAGFLVVTAAEVPPVEERFVLRALAQQAGVALLNAQLQADERAAAGRALEAKQDADRANQAKSEFLSGVSHELRTPLNAILGFGQLLQVDSQPEQQRDSADQILRAGEHLLSLIDEVLDLSRIESGTLALSMEPVNVGEVVTETLDLIRPLAAERGLSLQAPSEQEAAWMVRADRRRLRQILLNLASNAIKYNDDGGGISLGCQAVGDGRIRLTVSDTGPGIPADKLERLFTPFDRLGAEQTGTQGTGMGLALSKRLAEALGGTLTAYSVQGRGCTFALELAAAQDPLEGLGPSRPAAAPAPSDGPGPGPGPGGPRTVLCVEDNPVNLRLVEQILARRPGVRLLGCGKGGLAHDLARQHHPELILLDMHLPDQGGAQVLKTLQDDPATAGVPVVVVSADASPRQAKELLAAGARGYLTKPLDIARFLAVVDELLQATPA